MSSDSRRSLGENAEEMAARFLKKRGYRILDRNLQLRLGEIDILARQGDMLVIVEVKSAGVDSDFGPPVLRVNGRKQRKLRLLAQELLQRHRFHETDIRFDVVSVDLRSGEPVIELIENAF